jgi:hypothetical protein
MNKHVTPHMVEKLDRSAYVHENIAKDPDETEDEADSDADEYESEE